jgi:hypothetical protein
LNAAGAANSGTAAYFAGGYYQDITTYYSRIDKIAFSADTKSTLSATLTAAASNIAGAANSGTAAYFAGGTGLDGIDKISFSADTKSTLSAVLTTACWQFEGAADSGTAAYYAGGQAGGAGGYLSRFDKITFSADTKSTLSATLATSAQWVAGAANSAGL